MLDGVRQACQDIITTSAIDEEDQRVTSIRLEGYFPFTPSLASLHLTHPSIRCGTGRFSQNKKLMGRYIRSSDGKYFKQEHK